MLLRLSLDTFQLLCFPDAHSRRRMKQSNSAVVYKRAAELYSSAAWKGDINKKNLNHGWGQIAKEMEYVSTTGESIKCYHLSVFHCLTVNWTSMTCLQLAWNNDWTAKKQYSEQCMHHGVPSMFSAFGGEELITELNAKPNLEAALNPRTAMKLPKISGSMSRWLCSCV